MVTHRDVRDAVLGLLPTAGALTAASWLLTGLSLGQWWVGLAVAAVVAVADGLSRPVLRVLARWWGAVAALILGVVTQVLIVGLVLIGLPWVRVHSWVTVLTTFAVVGVVSVVVHWLLGVNDSSYLVADLLRRARRVRAAPAAGAPAGLVIVQVDGLPFPLLRHGIHSGVLPTLARWVRSGSHDAVGWWARVPSTTPASQAALLHGSNDGIPAFRWYEQALGRLVVSNRPADAALIEERVSDGRGLLAGGGVSIANMFSGDADTALMVMSRAGRRGGLGPGGDYLRFFARPFILVRSLVLTAGEIVKELHQGRQQRMRGVEPRIHRHGAYPLLRGLTNVLLRDLNVALVAEHMMRGAPVIFVDFVDYDEIAHHAGVARPESMDALAGVDRVLGTLEQLAAAAPRDYRFVVLSDHGQSQGPTFRQLSGRTLEEAVRAHLALPAPVTLAATSDVEGWGPVNALLADLLGTGGPVGRWAARRSTGESAGMLVGPPDAGPGGDRTDLVVVGSGNLGLIWFPRLGDHVTLEDLQERFPALIPGLLGEPGIGFVVAGSARGPLAIGPRGVHLLAEDTVQGEDPLGPFGPRAARDLLRVATGTNHPDLYVHSTLDTGTDEVHAFEELVGCHGGLGGWQNQAVLVHPAGWTVDEELLDDGELYGADAVHRQLIRWLERAGLRDFSR
ncbi:alkaline phosphatase family protein [Actinoplanes sp. NBRC 101535]|uniref:alkaline phosphatase family protein n=1 Tax=Actinoplanes sp. NBRC 101535 TaxID=3032196 RepID=UPI000A62C641|nr:alkaline phosphatase family protein [Actinoplanes sp. NBRC 101535]GLY02547.1 membrane protein [Actinoplanes sp. NBRC 101535]